MHWWSNINADADRTKHEYGADENHAVSDDYYFGEQPESAALPVAPAFEHPIPGHVAKQMETENGADDIDEGIQPYWLGSLFTHWPT